jgi:S-adenosylmethionine:tRNA ribosyltransferase-isomerase
LLILDRSSGELQHRHFGDILDYLLPGDVLVVNNSRVLPARLYGQKVPTGGKVELLLLESLSTTCWKVLVGGRRLGTGVQVRIKDRENNHTDIVATVVEVLDGPQRLVEFNAPLDAHLDSLGRTPLPPYITKRLADPERYQTVYSNPTGSAAAPTAGLHFTGELLLALRDKGVRLETVTLHIGLDTFKPVDAETVAEHTIHSEWANLSVETARRINEAKLAGGRIVAVGTTAVRVLETAALRSAGIQGPLSQISHRDAEGETSNICPWRPVAAFEGRTDLFIYPGYRYRAVDAMITNFHLPQSTLLMLVSAFSNRETILRAYQVAIELGYRFYSFGDAMFIR